MSPIKLPLMAGHYEDDQLRPQNAQTNTPCIICLLGEFVQTYACPTHADCRTGLALLMGQGFEHASVALELLALLDTLTSTRAGLQEVSAYHFARYLRN